ncbi:MAG TPA: twin-arginine translocation signal domain-containing protein, partial [Nevskiaceae bacterium]
MISRRDFLRYAGIGPAGLIAGLPLSGRAAVRQPFTPDVALELEPRPDSLALLPGAPTRVWKYRARVLHGDAASVQPLPGSWLGPTLHLRRGQRVQIDFVNRLE